jgi:molybdate transport system permease protein
MPLAIYGYTQTAGGDAQALRLCVISILLSLGALIASEMLMRATLRRTRG